jgi:Spy/CpxP family protein refolding chaperone
MKRMIGLSLFVALAATPAALDSQVPSGQERAMRGPAVGMLLGHRAQLDLTDEQVAQLQAIGQRLQAQNAPLMEQLRGSEHFQGRAGAMRGQRPDLTAEQRQQRRQQMRDATPEQRRQLREQRLQSLTPEQRVQMEQRREQMRSQRGTPSMRQVPEELRPTMQQIRTNMQAARQEALAVLTPEQRDRLQQVAAERGARAGERARRGPAGQPRR